MLRRRNAIWYLAGWAIVTLAMNPRLIGINRAGVIDEIHWKFAVANRDCRDGRFRGWFHLRTAHRGNRDLHSKFPMDLVDDTGAVDPDQSRFIASVTMAQPARNQSASRRRSSTRIAPTKARHEGIIFCGVLKPVRKIPA